MRKEENVTNRYYELEWPGALDSQTARASRDENGGRCVQYGVFQSAG